VVNTQQTDTQRDMHFLTYTISSALAELNAYNKGYTQVDVVIKH